MASDNIYLVPSETVDGWSGDQVGKMMDYVQHVFGRNYHYYEGYAHDTSQATGNTVPELHDWWADQSFTDYDKNLLIASVANWEKRGYATYNGNAAVICVTDDFHNLPDPATYTDRIGGASTGLFWARQTQASVALQELGHLYDARHKQGIGENHDNENYITPELTTYEDDSDYDVNQCNRINEYISSDSKWYVEGFSKCAVDNSNFSHQPARIYTKSEIEGI